LLVCITRIRGKAFRGKLVNRPAFDGLAKLRVGSSVTFTGDQIHSIPKELPNHEE
jgi:hypothetical protein